MFRKFVEGLVFGSGFAISFIALWYVAAYSIAPMIAGSFVQSYENQLPSKSAKTPPDSLPSSHAFEEPGKQFHELSIEEQIEKSSVIALARYEKSDDGKMKAVITEFLKKDPGVTIYYNIGDEYPGSSYYPNEGTVRGDGAIIFFTGSPASMRMAMTYTGNRIGALGDLPVELLRNKCKAPNA